MPMGKDFIKAVCAPGNGALTCSFLLMGVDGFECAKTGPFEGTLRARREAGRMNAMGDNCGGPPAFVIVTGKVQ